jgi:dUTP pyrophosphatase
LILKVKKLSEEAKLPVKATAGSACYDVCSTRDRFLLPMERSLIPTGLSFELPPGLGLDVRPRSGLALKGLVILNSPGTIDNDYRGELKVAVINLSSGPFTIRKGDRIAQVRPISIMEIELEEVEGLSETARGKGGFGSTGK